MEVNQQKYEKNIENNSKTFVKQNKTVQNTKALAG